ncbi:MAG: F0F1 ATP synthase subunit delta [Xanthomonadales bacterium]|nr:F0F1 ATP synthase subunit delta [Xanthomonadales bacterium]
MSSNAQTLARPYARAAFDLAKGDGLLADWSRRLAFSAQVADEPVVRALLTGPMLDGAAQVALMLPEGDTADGVYGRFLAVLARNGRLPVLPDIAAQFEVLRAEDEGVVKAVVRTAVPLEPAQADALAASLRRRFGRQVELRNEIDASVIAGAVIDADGTVIDGSVRGRLARMGSALSH